MKNSLPLALTVVLAAGALAATPAVAAEPAPGDVTIAWKDSTHTVVRVTWTENEPRPNKVVVRRPNIAQTFLPMYAAADAPNVIEYEASKLAAFEGTLEIGVSAGTESGETSEVTASAPFDTIDAGTAVRVSVALAGSNSVAAHWKQIPPSEQDVTPNDPLDLGDSVTYTPRLVAGGKVSQLAPASKATQVTVAGRALPYQIEVVTSNEWGGRSARIAGAGGSGLKAVIPTWVKSGNSISQPTITGTYAGRNAPVYLQARKTATSPWYTVASQQRSDGTFRFSLGASGSRQYRVLVPNRVDSDGTGYFGSYSPTVATTVQVNSWGALWTPATIRRGQMATAELSHSPVCSYTVILQRWTGKTWSTVGPVRTDGGVARGFVKGAAPGRVAYRYYLPAVAVNGYWYAAAYSANFVLSTTA
jgi:hypothetical protein